MIEFRRFEITPFGELDVLGNIDDDRPGTAARGNVKRLVQHARQIDDRFDEIIVLGAGPRDADRVAFLEGVIADHMRRHLPRDANQRDRVA